LFKTQGDAWVQTLSDPAREKVVTYWDGLIKKKLVSTIPGFTAEFYNAIGSGQIASSIEAAWGPGVLAASLNRTPALRRTFPTLLTNHSHRRMFGALGPPGFQKKHAENKIKVMTHGTVSILNASPMPVGPTMTSVRSGQ
jgi:hypothetical protein